MYDDLIHFLAPKFEDQVKTLELLGKEFDISFENPELAIESGEPINDLIVDRLRESGKLPPPLPGESQSDFHKELLPKAREVLAGFLKRDPFELPYHAEFAQLIPYGKRRKFFNELVSQVGSQPRYVGGSSFGCWTLFLLSFIGALAAVIYLARLDVPMIGLVPCFFAAFVLLAWIIDHFFTGYMYDFRFETLDDFVSDVAAEEADVAMHRQIARRALRVLIPLCDPELHEEVQARMEERFQPPKKPDGAAGGCGCGCGGGGSGGQSGCGSCKTDKTDKT